MNVNEHELEYVGFWVRVGALLIDHLLLMTIIAPIVTIYYGKSYWGGAGFGVQGPLDFILSHVFPAVVIVAFWTWKQATPGKMAVSAKIVDARTGNVPSMKQYIGRYLAYCIAMLPLLAGIIWIAFDQRKQGWHDKLAGTVVVRTANRHPQKVTFGGS